MVLVCPHTWPCTVPPSFPSLTSSLLSTVNNPSPSHDVASKGQGDRRSEELTFLSNLMNQNSNIDQHSKTGTPCLSHRLPLSSRLHPPLFTPTPPQTPANTVSHLRHGSTDTAKSHPGRRLNASTLGHTQVRPKPATDTDTLPGHLVSRHTKREL
jgi:hypothetical protein